MELVCGVRIIENGGRFQGLAACCSPVAGRAGRISGGGVPFQSNAMAALSIGIENGRVVGTESGGGRALSTEGAE